MEALKVATVIGPDRSHEADQPSGNGFQKPKIRLAPRIKTALIALLEAIDYGQDLERTAWDFAIELPCLRRMKLSNSDLRWLVGRELVDHAIEITTTGDAERSFRQPPRLMFCKRACFVLTSAGVALAREIAGREHSRRRSDMHVVADQPLLSIANPRPLTPTWDRNRQELKVGNTVVKRFRVPAANQEAILAAFEEEHWPPRIDDPLPPHREQSPKRRLQETIKSLNRNQKKSMIRFLGDGSGQGVLWEFCDDRELSSEAS
jgi:hypothetical protein